MSFFSNWRYRILGYLFRQKSEADAFRKSLKETVSDYKKAGNINEIHLAVEIEHISKQRESLTKSARQLAEHYVLTQNAEDAQKLWMLFERYSALTRRLAILQSTRQLLQSERDKRECGVADLLRMELLNKQHYRTKFNMNARRKSSFLAKRAMKLQLNEETAGDMRQELDDVLIPNEDNGETLDKAHSDENFATWISGLVTTCAPSRPPQNTTLSISEIEARLEALKE